MRADAKPTATRSKADGGRRRGFLHVALIRHDRDPDLVNASWLEAESTCDEWWAHSSGGVAAQWPERHRVEFVQVIWSAIAVSIIPMAKKAMPPSATLPFSSPARAIPSASTAPILSQHGILLLVEAIHVLRVENTQQMAQSSCRRDRGIPRQQDLHSPCVLGRGQVPSVDFAYSPASNSCQLSFGVS